MALYRRRKQAPEAQPEGAKDARESDEGGRRRPPSHGRDPRTIRSTPAAKDDDGAAAAESSRSRAAAPLAEEVEAATRDDDRGSRRQSFRVARFAILRLVGIVYLFAFWGAARQNRGLMGSAGLVPARGYMDELRRTYDSPTRGFLSHPTVYWFAGASLEDWHLDATAAFGTTVSLAVAGGLDSWLAMLALWTSHFSIVTVAEGNSFYSYGWESQLLETGFLSMWLCDLPCCFRGSNASSRPSLPVLWLFRWLCARISVGAGLIKIRGGECWRNKTCLYHHFETQPIPSPMSFFFHFLPKSALRRAVDLDFFVQLYAVWMVLVPGFNWIMTNIRRMGGFIQVGFMINIMLSGNFSILNHLTVVPALACLDDDCFPLKLKNYVYQRHRTGPLSQSAVPNLYKRIRYFVDISLVALVGMLSVPVVANLLQIGGKHQAMNASFSSFKLVNTYGAFGSVGEARYEPIISVSNDGQKWFELELPCKPRNVKRRPCFCAPYHYRLDWNIWFIGFKPHQSMLQRRESWMFEFIRKILMSDVRGKADAPWLLLLDPGSAELLRQEHMRFAKVDMYLYQMADPLWNITRKWLKGEEVIWWNREFEEVLIRPVQVQGGSLQYANL
ncbi:hypothetical protein ACHAWF_011547 [Thalassiosira exigua]